MTCCNHNCNQGRDCPNRVKHHNPAKKLYKQWKKYLSNSRLTYEEQLRRAREFSRKGMKPNE